MKTLLIASLSAAALWLTDAPQALAQEPVSTGTVQAVAPKTGVLTIRSTETAKPITFYGMQKATILTADGKPGVITDLRPGMPITVKYAVRGDRWFVSQVIVPGGPATISAEAAAVLADPALRTPAARDGDITTQPGSKAAVDFDRTTVPAGRAAVDGDITTKPAVNPATDFDITTKPTGNAAAATDRDITTQPGSQSGTPLRR